MLYTILVNWNGWRDTITCCESLRVSDHPELTVVICDNASGDASLAEIASWADARMVRADAPLSRPALPRVLARTEWVDTNNPRIRFVLLANADNYGFAGGNNVGIEMALADPACRYVLVLNNDTEVAFDALSKLQARAEEDPALVVVGATLVYHEKPETIQGLGCAYDRRRGRARTLYAGKSVHELPPLEVIESQMEYVIGAAMLIRADMLRRIGGLSEAYFLYYEELDLSQRLLPGERLGWAPGALIRHKVGGSIGTGRAKARPSNVSLYYDQRSRLRFYRTYWPNLTVFLILAVGKNLLAYLRKGDMVAIRVIFAAIYDYLTKPADYRANFSRFVKKCK